LHVWIGLGTGEATIKDGDYFGMPSIEAARLCDKAPAGGILVSPLTKALAARIEGARFESFGELDLKGIPEPMEALAVLREPLDPQRAGTEVGRWPLPESSRVVPRIAYVGRESERRLLELARGSARSGSRQVVLFSGEPGIGKARLASYAALGANADGFAVCWGACCEDRAPARRAPTQTRCMHERRVPCRQPGRRRWLHVRGCSGPTAPARRRCCRSCCCCAAAMAVPTPTMSPRCAGATTSSSSPRSPPAPASGT
jgi:hypothetical protein